MLNQYEVSFIVTPVLSDGELKIAIKKYKDLIKKEGGEIVREHEWGLKPLAYPIKKKTTGIYHWMEFKAEPDFIDKMELSFRRDENILRYLTLKLDKFSIDYNERKANGLIGRKKTEEAEAETAETENKG